MKERLKELIKEYNEQQSHKHLKLNWKVYEKEINEDTNLVGAIEYLEDLIMLNNFYSDCLIYWFPNSEKALEDVINLKHNPYSPNGRPINENAMLAFLSLKGVNK